MLKSPFPPGKKLEPTILGVLFYGFIPTIKFIIPAFPSLRENTVKTINELIDITLEGSIAYDDFLELESDVVSEYDNAENWMSDEDGLPHLLMQSFLSIKAANSKQVGVKPISHYMTDCKLALYWHDKLLHASRQVS
jgi:hypothetical protein